MKKKLWMAVLAVFVLSYADAQDKKSEIVLKVNNLFHLSRKPLSNYYALGGEAGIYFRNKVYIGLAQYSSLAPSNVWQNHPFDPDKTRMYEYSLQGGYKFILTPSWYLYTGVRAGYGSMHVEYRYNNGIDSDETMTKEQLGSFFATPDIKIGVNLHKYIGLEAGANYRYYFGGSEKWGLSPSDLQGVGLQISIVGKLPF
jgi:hypothetical protein